MQKIYIVTGANGFLGNNIVRQLIKKEPEAEIRALVSSLDRANALKDLKCQIFAGDITKPESLAKIFEVSKSAKVYVIHCAALVYIKSQPNPQVYQVNVNGTRNIVAKTLEIDGKLVCVNSVHAIPELPNHAEMSEVNHFNPAKVEGEYAKSKAEAAQYVLDAVKNRGLDACIVHPSGIIGPYDFKTTHLTQLLVDTAKGRLKAGVHGGYDFVDVRDVADGIISACDKGKPGETYILSGRYISVADLFKMISHATGRKEITTFLPMWLAKFTAPLSELYYNLRKQPPLYTKYSLYTLESNSNFSHAKADRELGYAVRPAQETIDDTIKWLREAGKIPQA